MKKKLLVFLQYIIPQHLLTIAVGWLAECRWLWLKNLFIAQIMRIYRIDLSTAVIENPKDYPSFNAFFTRQLKPTLRPIIKNPHHLLSPVDGCAIQATQIQKNQLLQAKNMYFTLETLLGNNQSVTQSFYNGSYATFYLAPHHYHRVHMPITGQLAKSIFIPGKLFSVNRMTSDIIPNLYARNERLVTYFDTAVGPMAVIMVGALIVGSIQTVWKESFRTKIINEETYSTTTIQLDQGEELGRFKMGSTVILLFSEEAKISWSMQLHAEVQMGQVLGTIER